MAIEIERRRLTRADSFRRSWLSRGRLIQILAILVVLGLWEFIGLREGDFFLAPPTSVISAFGEVISDGELWSTCKETIEGILIGFVIAMVIGIVLGILMGTYRPVAQALNPLVSAGYVVPEAALVPLLIIWFGLGMTPRIVAVVLFSVFEIIVTTYAGVRNVDPMMIDVARSFGAKRRQIFRQVIFVGALPYIFTGLRIGAARAVKGMVVAELLFAAAGIGGAIQISANAYRTDKVMVWVILVTIIGVCFAGLVQLVERLWMRSWHESYARQR
jgi:ABC-type nitrate/sulfonate/bicarbonate transport system permease component